MRLLQIAQHATDLDRAAAFYTDVLGAAPVARFDPPGLLFFDLDGVRLLLDRAVPPALLYLQVDDVRAFLDRLRGRGVAIETEAHLIHTDDAGHFGAPGTEEWMGFFRDSEGNLVGCASRHAPGRD
ncbi:MAG TPA: VOC family protein [Mycobacteriales bacterium]|nr:VOC family protein [Mycobacteriales bacterium]